MGTNNITTMTRLLQFCLVTAMLLALSYGVKIDKDQSLGNINKDENGANKLHAIQNNPNIKKTRSRQNKAKTNGQKRNSSKAKHRRANKKKGMQKKANENNRKIKNQKNHNKKSNGHKSRRRNTKKSGKKNSNNKKNLTHKKKNSRRLETHKKIKITKRLNKKRKIQGNKQNKNKQRQSSCIDESCIDNAVSHIKLAKDKVKNYLSQVTRVEKSQKSANSKSGKKGLFSPIINRIREAGGGNLSSLKCNGDSSGNGAETMTNLTIALGKCEKNINESCVGSIPTINTTATTICKAYMTIFDTLLKKCIALTGTAACSCWNDQSFTSVVAGIKTCDFSKENKKMTSAKKGCISAFGACRKIEDSVSETLSACSPSNTVSKGSAALKNGMANKVAATVFLKKINETINKNARAISNITCAAFVKKTKKISNHLFNAPLNKLVASIINETVNVTVGSCSEEEKTSLKEEIFKIGTTIEIIDEAIEDVQNDLKIQTGTTTSVASIDINVRSFGNMLNYNLLSI